MTQRSSVSKAVESLLDDEDLSGIESVLGDLDAVAKAVDEAEAMLESIDFSELPEAVDEEEVLEAIETGELPTALTESEDADVVKLRTVLEAIDVGRLLKAADVGDLWEAKRGFDDAVDDLARSGDDEDAGLIEKVAAAASGDADDGGAGALASVGDGLIGSDDEGLIDDVGELLESSAREAMADVDLEDGDLGEYEEVIQQQAMEGVDAFRDGLLRAHGKFERVVESNRERTRNLDRATNSRNPTAVSTMAPARADVASVPNYSTMPRQVRHSNAPSRKLIYGDRFAQERKRRGYD